MKLNKDSLLLYAVTDRTWLGENSLTAQIEESIIAGASFIQLREKDIPFDEFVQIAKEVKVITAKYQIPFVINDNVEVAMAVDAGGVHVGQEDMGATRVRELIGDDKILGVSVQTVEQALLAEKNGADYLGVGAMFSTSTKLNADLVSFEQLQEICNAVAIPVVAIGGITKDNILELAGSGIQGVAVVSAIFAQPDIGKATSEMRTLAKEMVKNS